MKTIFSCVTVIALLLCCTHNSNGQKVIYSDYSPYNIRSSNLSIVGKVADVLYTFRSYDNEYFLDAYNNDMVKMATVVLDFFPDKIYNVRFVAFPDKILVLYQNQEGTRISQYAALLNEKGILQKNPIKIEEKRTGFFGSGNKEIFSFAQSDNKEFIMIYSANCKNKTLEFTGYWLDVNTMKVGKKLRLEYKANDIISYNSGFISNEGQFFLPVFTSTGNRNFSDEYTLLKLKKNESTFSKTTLNQGDNLLAYPFQKLDNVNGKIHFASFYTSRKNGNNEGIAASSFDINTNQFSETNYIPFEDSIRGNGHDRKKEKAFNDFKIKQLIVKNDGGFLVVAEESYITTQSTFRSGLGFYSFYASPMMNQIIQEYHFNDILLLSYNNNHKLEWHTFIRKEQYSQEDDGIFSSFSMMNSGGGLGFLFNDFNYQRSRIQLSSVNAEGKVSSGYYLDAGGNKEPDWLPRLGKQIDSREIVVPCLFKKQLCFAKIVL